MKLSIIVPVYNVEPYLRRCVDSILAQTFTDYELILVDDGSPDGCPAICDEYAQKDSRIKVIHKENGGVSDARNTGLNLAQGEYIGFVDGDDYIHPQMYEIMYGIMTRKELSMLQCGLISDAMWTNTERAIPAEEEIYCYSAQNVLDHFFWEYWENFPGYVPVKIYKRSVFAEIKFNVGRVYEDIAILLDTISHCEVIGRIDLPLYCYTTRADSITRKRNTVKNVCDHLRVYDEQEHFFQNRGNVVQARRSQEVKLSLYMMYKLQSRLEYHEKSSFAEVDRGMIKGVKRLLTNPEICNLKKISFFLLHVSPKLTLRIFLRFFPEWVPHSLRP